MNIEDIADGRVTDDAATVSQVMLRFNSLRSEALPKGASHELIVRVAEERWKGTRPTWRRSSYSGNNGGQCVEVAAPGRILVRDSKDPHSAKLATRPGNVAEVHHADKEQRR